MRYRARICWNKDRWEKPSGVAATAEGFVGKTFVSENRFGMEEWLFARAHIIDGWQYGFMQQSLRLKHPHRERVRDVALYTIDDHRSRYYVGRIDGLELLDAAEAGAALDVFVARGWWQAMVDDVLKLRLDDAALHAGRKAPREIVNVRVRPDRAERLPDRRPVEDDYDRYQFYRTNPRPGRSLRVRAR